MRKLVKNFQISAQGFHTSQK